MYGLRRSCVRVYLGVFSGRIAVFGAGADAASVAPSCACRGWGQSDLSPAPTGACFQKVEEPQFLQNRTMPSLIANTSAPRSLWSTASRPLHLLHSSNERLARISESVKDGNLTPQKSISGSRNAAP